LVFHVPNGGKRSIAEAARLKWVGTLAGVPDLCLLAPVGRVFFMEIKTEAGRLSEDQKKIHGWLTAIGVGCAVIRSIDDARNALKTCNIPTRESDPLGHLDPTTREAWRRSAVEWRAERDKTEQGTDP
jgi:VRR-NUC domain